MALTKNRFDFYGTIKFPISAKGGKKSPNREESKNS
jgi:hypothetical protein